MVILIAGQIRYRVGSDNLYLNQSAAESFCQNQNSKLAEIKNELEINTVKLLLKETIANGEFYESFMSKTNLKNIMNN